MGSIYAQKREVILEFHKSEQLNWQQQINNAKLFNEYSGFDVTFYYLNLSINIESPYIQGSVLCRFRSEIDSLESIKVNLHHSLTIDSIKGNISDYKIVNDTILINLSEKVAFEKIDEITIYYQGVPELAYGYKGLRYELHGNQEPIIASLSTPYLAHYWWPCKDGPGDKADSVYIDITIPDTLINELPLLAISNGLIENLIISNGKKTFQWRERYPIVPYYVMVAISNYRYIKQYYDGIDGLTYFNEYLVFDEHLDEANVGVANLPEAINLFSNYFGDYPFKNEKYGMTQLGFYGAIENQTNTIINNMSLDWYLVSVHELAHMWFGDMITCQTWNHAWLNEGFASYCEALWMEYTEGIEGYKEYISYFEYYNRGKVYLEDDTDPLNIFISIIYDKGAYTLHMLRGVLGDSLFFLSLKNYATNPEFMYGHATTEDFINICEETCNKEMNWFFDQWIYDEKYPIYEYGYYQDKTTLETEVQINQIQSSFEYREVFEMPIQLKFNFIDTGDTLITVWNDQQFQTFTFDLAELIDSVEFDPNNWVLKKINMVTGIIENTGGIVPNNFNLSQNYPNPFNPSTTIEFSLPKSEFVSLKVYNILGEEITTIISKKLVAGNYTYHFDGSNLASGIYMYRIEAGKYQDIKKMVLVK
jgi:aminopeptidase N